MEDARTTQLSEEVNTGLVRTSEKQDKLSEALALAQGELQNAARDDQGHHAKFASIQSVTDTIRPVLSKQGIAFTQHLTQHKEAEKWSFSVTTRLMHKSGQWIESTMSKPIDFTKGNQQNDFEYGKSATYMRRYSLFAICGIGAGEDTEEEHKDTGSQAASKPRPAKKVGKKASAKAKPPQGRFDNGQITLNAPSLKELTNKYVERINASMKATDEDDWLKIQEEIKSSTVEGLEASMVNFLKEASLWWAEHKKPKGENPFG